MAGNSSKVKTVITSSIKQGVRTIRDGGVIAYPTEGVWGLGCDPFNQKAVAKVLQLKNRLEEKGLILVAANLNVIMPIFNELRSEQKALLEKSCPGSDTWLIPDSNQHIPAWIKGKFSSVAIRISEHPIVKGLCDELGGLIVSTSANPEGETPAMNEEELQAYFPVGIEGGVDYIVAGNLGSSNKASAIKDLLTGQTLRA